MFKNSNKGSKRKKTSKSNNENIEKRKSKNTKLIIVVIFFLGTLLIFATYAWFSVSLNVRVKTFRIVVNKNSGLTISFDAINFDNSLDLSRQIIIDDLKRTYPNNTSQWASGGLIPVSSPGLPNSNTYYLDMFASEGVIYRNKRYDVGYVETLKEHPVNAARPFNNYISFDLFFKNDSGSPVPDNLYFHRNTSIVFANDSSEQMQGLLNSARIAVIKVGSLPIDADPTAIQNLQCNNNCQAIIYEPYSTVHNSLSRERASKYGINLIDGQPFPTYAYRIATGPLKVADTISGSPNLNMNTFVLQNTINENAFSNPIFEVPYGITKARVYVWLEGQDIDSLETDSEGADVDISIDFVKDTKGYELYG